MSQDLARERPCVICGTPTSGTWSIYPVCFTDYTNGRLLTWLTTKQPVLTTESPNSLHTTIAAQTPHSSPEYAAATQTYHVIEHEDLEQLVAHVNRLIADGSTPLGGISVHSERSTDHPTFRQAILSPPASRPNPPMPVLDVAPHAQSDGRDDRAPTPLPPHPLPAYSCHCAAPPHPALLAQTIPRLR